MSSVRMACAAPDVALSKPPKQRILGPSALQSPRPAGLAGSLTACRLSISAWRTFALEACGPSAPRGFATRQSWRHVLLSVPCHAHQPVMCTTLSALLSVYNFERCAVCRLGGVACGSRGRRDMCTCCTAKSTRALGRGLSKHPKTQARNESPERILRHAAIRSTNLRHHQLHVRVLPFSWPPAHHHHLHPESAAHPHPAPRRGALQPCARTFRLRDRGNNTHVRWNTAQDYLLADDCRRPSRSARPSPDTGTCRPPHSPSRPAAGTPWQARHTNGHARRISPIESGKGTPPRPALRSESLDTASRPARPSTKARSAAFTRPARHRDATPNSRSGAARRAPSPRIGPHAHAATREPGCIKTRTQRRSYSPSEFGGKTSSWSQCDGSSSPHAAPEDAPGSPASILGLDDPWLGLRAGSSASGREPAAAVPPAARRPRGAPPGGRWPRGAVSAPSRRTGSRQHAPPPSRRECRHSSPRRLQRLEAARSKPPSSSHAGRPAVLAFCTPNQTPRGA